jgi:serine/threonine-protein kinase RsbW
MNSASHLPHRQQGRGLSHGLPGEPFSPVTAPVVAPLVFDVRIKSDPARLAEVRHDLEAFCEACGLGAVLTANVGLCVNEALANVIRHAYRGRIDRPIHVRAECEHGELWLSIRDWGNGMAPDLLPVENYDPLMPGGLGLVCLKQLMDEVMFVPQRDGMLLSMRKRLEQARR